MYDPTSGQEVILRITGYTPDVKKFRDEHPEFASIPLGDMSAPVKPMLKKELPAFICFQVLPTLLEHFTHYDDNEELLFEFGMFNHSVTDKDITPENIKKGVSIIRKLLQEVT